MATRQRARPPKKAPAIPMQSGDTDADTVGASPTSDSGDAGFRSEPESTVEPPVRFVGEQVTYKSREERIAENAYLYAAARGFQPGYELEDWLKAERQIDALLSGSGYPVD